MDPPRCQGSRGRRAAGGSEAAIRAASISIIGAAAIPPISWQRPINPTSERRFRRLIWRRSQRISAMLYRSAGFHLSRAIVPPQDISGGSVRIQVIEGSITDARSERRGAEEFGVRPMLDPVLAEHPSRLATLERQLLLINGRPGVRIADTALEEIGGAERPFPPDRLCQDLAHLYLVRHRQSWRRRRSGLGKAMRPARSIPIWRLATRWRSISRPRPTIRASLRSAGCPTTPRSAIDGMRIGASGLYSEVGLATTGACNDNTTTEGLRAPRQHRSACSRNASSLTLTRPSDFSNVSESDMFGPIYNDHIRTISLTSDYRLAGQFRRQQLLHVT